MEIEEVEYGGLNGVAQQFVVKVMIGLAEAIFNPAEITFADKSLFVGQAHDRVEKECYRAFGAVVALRRAEVDKLRCGVEYLDPEVG